MPSLFFCNLDKIAYLGDLAAGLGIVGLYCLVADLVQAERLGSCDVFVVSAVKALYELNSKISHFSSSLTLNFFRSLASVCCNLSCITQRLEAFHGSCNNVCGVVGTHALDGFEAIIPISARTGEGLDELMAELQKFARPGPQLFPDGMTTDQPDAQVCAEMVREKMLLCLDKEIPHGTAVEVTRFTERDNGIIDLDVTIYCEKASHKGIIIGKHGDMLKKISTLARQDIEKFMGTKVYMETWVKVKENWRDNVNFIRSQGYSDK